MSASPTCESAMSNLLAAIASRDLDRIGGCFHGEVSWQNIPHPPALGRQSVVDLLASVITLSEQVEWEVVTASYDSTRAWVERIDHFWIDGYQHSVACNGVFTFNPQSGLLTNVRDYVDLSEWLTRIGPVVDRRQNESAETTVARHLAAVNARDVVSMAADYRKDAVLVRGEGTHEGRSAIAEYFRTVPDRLGDNSLKLASPVSNEDGSVTVSWSIVTPSGAEVASGSDIYIAKDGQISLQEVTLYQADF